VEFDRLHLEQQLRVSLTSAEYKRLILQLQDAVSAFAVLQEDAPDLLPMLRADLHLVSTERMTGRAEDLMRMFAAELRAVHAERQSAKPNRAARRYAWRIATATDFDCNSPSGV
jgi:hypothetical protein